TWLQGEYRSKRWRGVGAEQDTFGDYNAFTLFHLGASYRISENVTVNGTIYNLLDEDFLQYHAYNDAGKTEYANEYNNNQEGRRFWISTNITF
ncbi:MAG: TonB-dependent receptor domain-containing protein, partial [Aeromonas sobria]